MPTLYDDAVRDRIIDRLAKGETLRAICRDDDMPDHSTVALWVMQDVDEDGAEGPFAKRYAQARKLGLDVMAEETLEIADDSSHDTLTNAKGQTAPDAEWIARSKLRVDTRKWLLSKLRPDVYGDRTALQMLDEHGKPAKAGVTIIIDGASAPK